MMRISAPGNSRSHGFTLLELMVVVTIIAVASAGIALALRDAAQSRLDTEAYRLAAALEAARAQSRASGQPLRWKQSDTNGVGGFVLDAPTDAKAPALPAWRAPGITARVDQPLLLGPEPIIPAQSVRLWLVDAPQRSLHVSTDGLRPFAVSAVQTP